MARYLVTFSATTQIPVVAADEDTALRVARRQLDPDVDWDCDSCDNVTDIPEHDYLFDDEA
jgi:hypothetical protein